MENIQDMIAKVVSEIEQVTNYFYQQKNNEGYEKLMVLIDTLVLLTQHFAVLAGRPEIVDINNKLLNSLNDATEALVNKDNILLADILRYDIADVLNEATTIIIE